MPLLTSEFAFFVPSLITFIDIKVNFNTSQRLEVWEYCLPEDSAVTSALLHFWDDVRGLETKELQLILTWFCRVRL